MKIRLKHPDINHPSGIKKTKIHATKKRKNIYKKLLIISSLLNVILLLSKFL